MIKCLKSCIIRKFFWICAAWVTSSNLIRLLIVNVHFYSICVHVWDTYSCSQWWHISPLQIIFTSDPMKSGYKAESSIDHTAHCVTRHMGLYFSITCFLDWVALTLSKDSVYIFHSSLITGWIFLFLFSFPFVDFIINNTTSTFLHFVHLESIFTLSYLIL